MSRSPSSAVVTSPLDVAAAPGPVNRARWATRRPRTAALLLRFGTLLGLVVVWEFVVEVVMSPNDYIASPSAIVQDGLSTLTDSATVSALEVTAGRYLAAFAISAVVGIAIGLALSRLGRFEPPTRDLLYILYTVPQVPLYPLFLLWFGLGFKSEVAFGVSHGILPVIVGTMAAASHVDEGLLDSARSMGAGPLQRIRVVVIPSIVPGVVGALRVGASLCLVGVLVAELLVSVDGIGGIISQLAGTLQPAALDAVILAVCIAAVLINSVIRFIEHRLSRWREAA